MSDLEITRLCAEAMGHTVLKEIGDGWLLTTYFPDGSRLYHPITNDEQAMTLMKKFKLSVGYSEEWGAKMETIGELLSGSFHYPDLNAAVCVCVANWQKGKATP